MRKVNDLIDKLALGIEMTTYYTCPYCGEKSIISEAHIVEQKDKTIHKETRFKTGALGKQYLETIEVYSVYRIRKCPKCTKKKRKQTILIIAFFAIILPIVIGTIMMSFTSFFLSIFGGLILSCLIGVSMDEKIDIEDAFKKNAIDNRLF